MASETRTVMIPSREIVSMRCDVCQAECTDRAEWQGWESFTTGHNDWGNDSFESRETLDVCSVQCLLRLIIEIANRPGEHRSDYLELDRLELDWLKHIAYFLTDGNKYLLPPSAH